MTKLQTSAVTAGILIGIAFMVIRLSIARTVPDYFLAAGTTGLEIAVVLLLERKARKLDATRADYANRYEIRQCAVQSVATATDDVRRIAAAIAAVDEEIKCVKNQREINRALADEPGLMKSCVEAAQAAYLFRISERRGLQRGGTSREEV